MNGIRHAVSTRWRLLLFLVLMAVSFWALWTLASAILPFVVGVVAAYLLLPLVQLLERHLPGKKRPGLRRGLIIAAIYLVGFAILGTWAIYLGAVVVSSFALLFENAPDFVSGAYDNIQQLIQALKNYLPPDFQSSLDQAVQSIGQNFIGAIQGGFTQAIGVIASSATFILGFISLPFFVFFVLKDWETLRDGFYGTVPEWGRRHARNVGGIVDRVFGRYLRAQMIMALIIGVLVFIMLTIFGISYAPALASLSAVMEFIPVLGPWISGIAGVAIALATDPGKAIWVAVSYLAIQQVENNVLVPRVAGTALRMHPVFILVSGVVGAYLAGILGFIIAVPLTATAWELFKYVRTSLSSGDGESTIVVPPSAGPRPESGPPKAP